MRLTIFFSVLPNAFAPFLSSTPFLLQCVAIRCSALFYVAAYYSVALRICSVPQLHTIPVAVCCSKLQCVVTCCSVLQWCVSHLLRSSAPHHSCCSVLQCVAVHYTVLQCVAVCCSMLQYVTMCRSMLQCVVVRCSVLQRVAVCCSVLQFLQEHQIGHN